MICCKVKKLGVLICLWVLWSTTIISIHVKAACDDSLKPGDTLHAGATSELCSKKGKCSLFFALQNEGGYLSITCTLTVWMYNRKPIKDGSSAVLSLNLSGVLKIESQYGKPIILYSPPQPTHNINTVATLLDTGNFVLQQLHPNGTKSVLWQSFDYPANALLPTMKLGVNRKTGHNWSLVSALNKQVGTPGAFSLEWEPKARELVIKKRGRVCWKSGKLGNNGLFENIPKDIQSMYQYTIISNSDEDSFTFKIKTSQNKDGKFQGWKLLPTGQLTKPNVGGDIARADMCYGYNSDGGCQRWEDIPTCREPGDVFQQKFGSTNYANLTYIQNTSYTYNDCKDICWSDCNCTGFRELYHGNDTGCIFYMWNSIKNGDAEDNINMFQFHMLIKPVKAAPHHGKKRWIWISAVIAAALLVTCPPILCLVLKKRKYAVATQKSGGIYSRLMEPPPMIYLLGKNIGKTLLKENGL